MRNVLLARLYVGSYMGVPTYLHWSTFIMFGLFLLAHNEVLALQYVLLLLSVLVHELGHCYFAKKYNMEVSSITLSPIGGVAGVHMGIPEPTSEFVMTAAGPLTSLALSIVAIPIWHLSPEGSLVAILSWFVVWVNAWIFLFNAFVPAFPMDGGRMLRAFLNWKLGNVLLATEITIMVGRIACIIMVLVAIIYKLPFLTIIGWLMYFMGPAELRDLKKKVELERRLMTYNL